VIYINPNSTIGLFLNPVSPLPSQDQVIS